MTTNHTPTQRTASRLLSGLSAQRTIGTKYWMLIGPNGSLVADSLYEPSAVAIRDACNAHDALTARVAELEKALEALADQSEIVAGLQTCGEREFLKGLAKAARAVLA